MAAGNCTHHTTWSIVLREHICETAESKGSTFHHPPGLWDMVPAGFSVKMMVIPLQVTSLARYSIPLSHEVDVRIANTRESNVLIG